MEKDPSKIRVQDYNLSISDLMHYPVWEYVIDEVIEGQEDRPMRPVKPYLAIPPLNRNAEYCIVRVSFVLADGSCYKGYMKLIGSDRVDTDVPPLLPAIIPYDLRPVIILGNEQIEFQYGPEKPDTSEMKQVYDLFDKSSDDIFPIKFSSDVEVLNCVTEGRLDGFMYFEKNVETFAQVKSLRSSDIRYAK